MRQMGSRAFIMEDSDAADRSFQEADGRNKAKIELLANALRTADGNRFAKVANLSSVLDFSRHRPAQTWITLHGPDAR